MSFFTRQVIFAILAVFSLNLYAEVPESVSSGVVESLQEMTIQAMYQNAHPVVKGVLVILVLCSVITWTIFVFKIVQFRRGIYQLNKEQQQLQQQSSLADLNNSASVFAKNSIILSLFSEVRDEMERSQQKCDEAFTDRVDYRLERQIQHWVYRIRYGIGVLATIGSVAPFIGLFGTVWGIMNSFIGIVNAKSTNLAVVAPGIAEALFATALGLVAAIPAVMMYNYFTRYVSYYGTLVGNLVAILRLMVKRDISLNRLSSGEK